MADSDPETLPPPSPPMVALEERIELTYTKWIKSGGKKGKISMRSLARSYSIPRSTFSNRYKGIKARLEAYTYK